MPSYAFACAPKKALDEVVAAPEVSRAIPKTALDEYVAACEVSRSIPKKALEERVVASEVSRSESGLVLIGDLCAGFDPPHWKYVLQDESKRSFAGYLPSPFTKRRCTEFFNAVNNGTHWKRPRDMLRDTAWMVAKGCACTCNHAGYDMEPQEYPAWMVDIMRVVMPFFGLPMEADWPNSCNLNLYDTGGSSVAWHADDEALFNGKVQDVRILSLSLGARRYFELRANTQNESRAAEEMQLGDGDLCTMEGMAQKHYQHRVPPDRSVEEPRINLTWRWIVKHRHSCSTSKVQAGGAWQERARAATKEVEPPTTPAPPPTPPPTRQTPPTLRAEAAAAPVETGEVKRVLSDAERAKRLRDAAEKMLSRRWAESP